MRVLNDKSIIKADSRLFLTLIFSTIPLQLVGSSEPKKCKGIKKCVVKKTITFEDYKRCLFDGRNVHRSQLLFRSNKHEVKTLEVNKLALNSQDDKRISVDGIASYAIGHHRVWGME